ncbi:MAG: hypothetical protein AAF494_14315 [Pseudomonadota bacterium]
MPFDTPLKKPRLIGSVAGLAALVALSGKASAANGDAAASQSQGLVDISDLPGVIAHEMRSDGSVVLTFDDGSIRVLSAGEVIVENGVIFIDPQAIAEMELGGGVDPLILALGVLGVAGAAVAIASSDDDDDDAPVLNGAPVINSANAVTVDENETATGLSVSAADPEGDPVTFSIVGGADADLFEIDAASGALSFIAAPDFEVPGDADGDNVFEVQVEATDGNFPVTQLIQVTVNNINDNAPVIVSAAAVSVRENAAEVTTVEVEDADGDAITFSLSGTDAALFTIDAATGLIAFIDAPDFENPGDDGADNIYNVTVTASDGVNEVVQDLAITVTDQNEVVGTAGNDVLVGSEDDDVIDALAGDDIIDSLQGSDLITTGTGSDRLLFAGDPFEGADVSADGRQIVGGEDFITDFDFAEDSYQFDAEDFAVGNAVNFVALDANAQGAEIPAGSNVIVLLNSDNDGDPATPFLAGTAAGQIAALVDEPGPGFFVYWNSNLGVNRLVYSTDLSSADADLKIVSRQTDLEGQDAIDALANFTAENFTFFSSVEIGTDAGETLTGTAGNDLIDGLAGDDLIESLEGSDDITTGEGNDVLAFEGDPFEGADVSAAGRQIVGGEDFVRDFDFAADLYQFDASDFGVSDTVSFVSLDANAQGAQIPQGANVIVLLNSDNDGDPNTPFLAGTAAAQIAALVDDPGPGFFVYWNSNLGVNRLVYSTDLSDPAADLKILSRQTDLTGQDAIDALANFSAENFVFTDSAPNQVTLAAESAQVPVDALFNDPLDDGQIAALAQANVDASTGGL